MRQGNRIESWGRTCNTRAKAAMDTKENDVLVDQDGRELTPQETMELVDREAQQQIARVA